MSKRDESELQADKWSANWEAQAQHGTPSVLKNVLKIYLAPFAFGGLFKLVQDIMLFVNPYVLQLIIRYMSDPDAELSQGIFYAFILLVAAVVQSFALHNYFIRVYRVGMNVCARFLAYFRFALRSLMQYIESPSNSAFLLDRNIL